MDLTIALIKHTRSQLKSCQLPIIALQALEAGYNSKSLVQLAGESGSIAASEVNTLFESALSELDIRMPTPSYQSSDERPKPLSAYSMEFTKIIEELIQNHGEIFILQRFAYTAGAGAGSYLIKTKDQWKDLLDSGKSKTAYTLYQEPIFSLRGIGNNQLQVEALALFDKLGDLLMSVIPLEDTRIYPDFIEWTPTGWHTQDALRGLEKAKSQIVNFFDENQGYQLGIDRSLAIWDENIRKITAYIPDEDGVIRPGAY